ncbi:MAG TPA: hypothetical protein VF721_06395 [Pyrinomonadaceae bacterium]|jgi:hypothetical protein
MLKKTAFLLLGITFLGLLLFIIFFPLPTTKIQGQKTTNENKTFSVNVTQLSAEKGKIPVELKCREVLLLSPERLENLSCVAINNTNKYITALVVAFSIITEKDGKSSETGRIYTLETIVHPNLREKRRNAFIPPSGEGLIEPLTTSFEDEVITGVTMRIDYAEFEDNTGIGANLSGSRILADMRDGAIKFRNFLAQKYTQSNLAASEIVPLLQTPRSIMDDLKLQQHQFQGADIYRKYLRRAYKSGGAESLKENLLDRR